MSSFKYPNPMTMVPDPRFHCDQFKVGDRVAYAGTVVNNYGLAHGTVRGFSREFVVVEFDEGAKATSGGYYPSSLQLVKRNTTYSIPTYSIPNLFWNF